MSLHISDRSEICIQCGNYLDSFLFIESKRLFQEPWFIYYNEYSISYSTDCIFHDSCNFIDHYSTVNIALITDYEGIFCVCKVFAYGEVFVNCAEIMLEAYGNIIKSSDKHYQIITGLLNCIN